MAKVVSNSDIIAIHLMKDGDVAEVVSSDVSTLKVETVVQRFGDTTIIIGEYSGNSYPGLINASLEGKTNVKVKILRKGALIQL